MRSCRIPRWKKAASLRNSRNHAPAELAAEVVDLLAQERDGLLGVVDNSRALIQAQDEAGLGGGGQERIVNRVFQMMPVETPEGLPKAAVQPARHIVARV